MNDYDCADVSPETIGRLVIPKNIRCLISDNNYTKLLKKLRNLYDVNGQILCYHDDKAKNIINYISAKIKYPNTCAV
jgi:hypothetical protein